MTEFHLVILTPDCQWFDGPAAAVTAPGQTGEFGVLANHIPMIAGLKAGAVAVRVSGREPLHFAIDGGVLGVHRHGVRILVGRVASCAGPEQARAAAAAFAREA